MLVLKSELLVRVSAILRAVLHPIPSQPSPAAELYRTVPRFFIDLPISRSPLGATVLYTRDKLGKARQGKARQGKELVAHARAFDRRRAGSRRRNPAVRWSGSSGCSGGLHDKMKGQSARVPALSSLISREFYRSSLGGISSSFNGISQGDARYSSTLIAPPKRKGTGGRSSVSGYVATVFGATGFVGRYVVQQLARMGSQVFVPYRGLQDDFKHLKLMGDLGQVVPIRYNVRDEDSIKAAMARSNVVVNLIGKDFETNNFSFQELNVDVPERISRLAREHGVGRYIQVSALGASSTSPASQYRTKAAGEAITTKNFPEATILRPAQVVGTEDRILNKWALFAKKAPTVPIIGDGTNRMQPVHVTDVAAAIVSAVKDDGSSIGKTFELGGPDVYTVNELVALVYEAIREEPHSLHIPFPIARLMAAPDQLFKRFPFPTPKMVTFSLNNVEAMQVDYVVSPDALTFKDLGIIPRKLAGVAIEHLYQWRAGGPSVGATVGDRVGGAGF